MLGLGLSLTNACTLKTGIRGLYRGGGLSTARQALRAATSVQATIIYEGDSVIVGKNADDGSGLYSDMRRYGHVGQVRQAYAEKTGVDAGEGVITFAYADEPRWTHTLGSPSAAGPVTMGRSIPVGGKSAGSFDFSIWEFACVLPTTTAASGVTSHPARVVIDSVDVTPSKLTADQKSATIGATGWSGRSNATSSQVSSGVLRATAAGSGAVSMQTATGLNGFDVTPGMAIIVTCAAYTETNARVFSPSIRFADASGVDLAAGAEANIGSKTTVPGSYVQASGVVTVPSGAAKAYFVLRGTSTFSAGETIDFKAFDIIPTKRSIKPSANIVVYGGTVSAGTHAVEIQGPLAANADASDVVQASWFNALKSVTAGVIVHNVGKSGSTSKDHAVGSPYSASTQANMRGSMLALVSNPTKTLAVIALGKNCMANSNEISPDDYYGYMGTLVAAYLAVGVSVLLLSDTRYNDDVGRDYPEESYYAKLRQLASENGKVAYFDANAYLGGIAKSDDIHPPRSGHTRIKDAVMRALA